MSSIEEYQCEGCGECWPDDIAAKLRYFCGHCGEPVWLIDGSDEDAERVIGVRNQA